MAVQCSLEMAPRLEGWLGVKHGGRADLWVARQAGSRVTQKEYRIIYAIDEKAKVVKLARILHRDWDYQELDQIRTAFAASRGVRMFRVATTRASREERGSCDEHIRQLIGTLVSPISTVSQNRAAALALMSIPEPILTWRNAFGSRRHRSNSSRENRRKTGSPKRTEDDRQIAYLGPRQHRHLLFDAARFEQQ